VKQHEFINIARRAVPLW